MITFLSLRFVLVFFFPSRRLSTWDITQKTVQYLNTHTPSAQPCNTNRNWLTLKVQINWKVHLYVAPVTTHLPTSEGNITVLIHELMRILHPFSISSTNRRLENHGSGQKTAEGTITPTYSPNHSTEPPCEWVALLFLGWCPQKESSHIAILQVFLIRTSIQFLTLCSIEPHGRCGGSWLNSKS